MRKAEIKNFTWHDLRHTFASRLVMEGVDLRTVAELMGHKGTEMLHSVYSKLSKKHKHLHEAADRATGEVRVAPPDTAS